MTAVPIAWDGRRRERGTAVISFYEGMREAMVKSAEMSERNRRRLRTAVAGLGAAGLTAGALAMSRRGIRANTMAYLRGLRRGGARAVERSSSIPAEALAQAEQVANALRERGLDPRTARIAIAGTGGTGKSTLARGLSHHLGMQTKVLDDVGMTPTGRDYVSYLKKNPIPHGYIAEQTHLLNQVDPNHFDAIIRVHKPMDQVKNQILNRGRGAAQIDLYDYDRLNKSIGTSFESALGTKFSPVSGIDIKMRPQDGFHGEQGLRSMIASRGLKAPENATREQLVYLASHGQMPIGIGILPYLRKRDIAVGAGITGVAGATGAYGMDRMNKTSSRRRRMERGTWFL